MNGVPCHGQVVLAPPPPPPPPPAPPPNGGMRKPDPTITTLAASKAGYTTYRVSVMLPEARDVYAVFGQPGAELVLPPAFQVATPFGSNVGE